MIIPDSFKQTYNAHYAVAETIKSEVDGVLRQITVEFPGTAYYSRIKSLESMFIKTLLGNHSDPFIEMEDFFACTLVLPTLASIPEIRAALLGYFNVSEVERRIPNPYEFQYSDLHLILMLKDSPLRSDKSVLNRQFELQLKTLLQSAWSQAGHDLVYKPARISWGAERIAGQMRALLELADSVLAQIEETAQLLHAQSEQTYTEYKGKTKQIIEVMENHWGASTLPKEKRRMAEVVNKYLQIADVGVDDLEKLITDAKGAKHPIFDYVSLSPIQQVFILIYLKYTKRVQSKLDSGKHRVLITPEMVDLFPELQRITKGRVNYLEPPIFDSKSE